MTETEAFEYARKTIQEMRLDADDFYLHKSDFEDGNWIIMIGYIRYWEAEDICRDEYESLGLTDDDIGEPSGHWQSQVQILPNGDGILNTDDLLDIYEHPDCMPYTEGEWRHLDISGLRDEDEDVDEDED